MPPIDLCWGTLSQLRLVPLLKAATSGGFDGVTATPAMVRQALADRSGRAEFKAHVEEAGIVLAGLDPLVAPLPGTPQSSSDDVINALLATGAAEAFDLASAAGARVVNLAHYLGDPATPRTALIDAIAAVCALAQPYGLRLTLEFFPESAIPDLPSAVEIVQAVGAPNLGVLVDTLHFCRSGGSVEQLATADGAVTGIQVADWATPPAEAPYVPMSGRLLPGDGDLPLVEVTGAALRAGARGTRLGLEVFSAPLRSLDPDEAALRSGRAVRRLLDDIARHGAP